MNCRKKANAICQNLIDFEGFRPNGYHHVNQRIFLRRSQWSKIDFDVSFLENLKKNQDFRQSKLKQSLI